MVDTFVSFSFGFLRFYDGLQTYYRQTISIFIIVKKRIYLTVYPIFETFFFCEPPCFLAKARRGAKLGTTDIPIPVNKQADGRTADGWHELTGTFPTSG
jgi:hypothetical protein